MEKDKRQDEESVQGEMFTYDPERDIIEVHLNLDHLPFRPEDEEDESDRRRDRLPQQQARISDERKE